MDASAPSRIGVLDIGSNSVRLVIYQLSGLAFTPIYNEKVLAGLGRDIRITGQLSPSGKTMALAALKRFRLLVDGLKLDRVMIAATAAMRIANDAPEFIHTLKAETGFEIKPLSGEEEAYYAALGVVAGEPRAHGLCADLGGASLELTPIGAGVPQPGVSLALGPFAVYEGQFDVEQARSRIRKDFQALDQDFTSAQLYLVGGAWRNLALIHQARSGYPLKVAQNYTWTAEEAVTLANWGCTDDGQQTLKSWPGLRPQRADTLSYSCLMIGELLKLVQAQAVTIAPGGIRDGLVFSTFPEHEARDNALGDACRDLAKGNREGEDFGDPLYAFLEAGAAKFPMAFDLENENRLRRAACQLVGIGKGLHPDHKAKMVFRTVLYAPLPGLTHKERAYLALMLFASYTSKSTSPNADAIEYLLNTEEINAARIYGCAMRLGVTLTARSAKLISGLSLVVHPKTLELKLCRDRSDLETDRINYRMQEIAVRLGLEVKITTD